MAQPPHPGPEDRLTLEDVPSEKFADMVCTNYAKIARSFSKEERLEAIRNPTSAIGWVYNFVYDHMLGCILSPKANEAIDLLKAAEHGFKKLVDARTAVPSNIYYRVLDGSRLLYDYKEAESELRIDHALKRFRLSCSEVTPEHGDCAICLVSLQQENTDMEWATFETAERRHMVYHLQILNPEFLERFSNWDGSWATYFGIDRKMINLTQEVFQARDHFNQKLYGEDKLRPLWYLDSKMYDWQCYFGVQYLHHYRINQEKERRVEEAGGRQASHNMGLVQLQCGHKFHRDCIRHWLVESDGTCPCCRYDVAKRPRTKTGQS